MSSVPTLAERAGVALFSSLIMAISAGFSAYLIARFAFEQFNANVNLAPFIGRYVLTGFIAEFPLWFVGAYRLQSRNLAVRIGFGMLLGFLNALLCHGLALFATDLYNLITLPGISFSWERIGHSFLGSVQFGLIWVSLVGKITLTAGVLFGALTGLLLPSFASYLQRGRATPGAAQHA